MSVRRRYWSIACGIFLFAVSAFSQDLSVGIKGGAPLTKSVLLNPDNFTWDSARKYLIGGTVELGFHYGFSVEADVLFHPFDLKVGNNPPPPYVAETLYDYTAFEIPVLAKQRLTKGLIRPYVEGGPSFRVSPNGLNVSHAGITLGVGVEIGKSKFFKVSPEIRYTHWGADSLIKTTPNVQGEQKNQVAVLLGVSF